MVPDACRPRARRERQDYALVRYDYEHRHAPSEPRSDRRRDRAEPRDAEGATRAARREGARRATRRGARKEAARARSMNPRSDKVRSELEQLALAKMSNVLGPERARQLL